MGYLFNLCNLFHKRSSNSLVLTTMKPKSKYPPPPPAMLHSTGITRIHQFTYTKWQYQCHVHHGTDHIRGGGAVGRYAPTICPFYGVHSSVKKNSLCTCDRNFCVINDVKLNSGSGLCCMTFIPSFIKFYPAPCRKSSQ